MVGSWTRDAFPGSKRTVVPPSPAPTYTPFHLRSRVRRPTPIFPARRSESKRSAQPQRGKRIPGPQERRVCWVGGSPQRLASRQGFEPFGGERRGGGCSESPPPAPPLRKSHLGGARKWGSPTLLLEVPERRAGGRAVQARGYGHQVREDLASGSGPSGRGGSVHLWTLRRSFWLFQTLWWMREGEALFLLCTPAIWNGRPSAGGDLDCCCKERAVPGLLCPAGEQTGLPKAWKHLF